MQWQLTIGIEPLNVLGRQSLQSALCQKEERARDGEQGEGVGDLEEQRAEQEQGPEPGVHAQEHTTPSLSMEGENLKKMQKSKIYR